MSSNLFEIPKEKWEELALYMKEKIRARVRIQVPRIRPWAHDLRMLNTKNGFSYEEIKEMIDYSQNTTNTADTYFPVILSPKALREKWDKLETAKIRLKAKYRETAIKNKTHKGIRRFEKNGQTMSVGEQYDTSVLKKEGWREIYEFE